MSVAYRLDGNPERVPEPSRDGLDSASRVSSTRLDGECTDAWVDVCALADIPVACGVAALLEGRQIALVRPDEDERVFAISNFDPFSEAFVIARGIVGDKGGRKKIASPIFKQSFDLETGACLDDPSVRLPVYPVRVRDGRVEVAIPA